MNFKEFLKNDLQGDFTDTNMRLSDLGALNFGPSITNKDVIVTPHTEILAGMEMYEKNAIVNSGLNQLLNFVIPNTKIKISSEDEWTVNYLEKWHSLRKGSLTEIKNIWLTNRMTGNGYEERYFVKDSNGQPVLDNFFSINDASRIYINPNSQDGSDKYIFELPIGTKSFMYRGERVTPTFHQIQYIKNYEFTFKTVYGFTIPDWKIAHFSSGWSRDNIYGRSQLVSAMDAHNIMQEIMSSWDTISKTRQIDQKIISVADSESGLQIPQERLDDLAEALEDADKSYTLFNVPLKILNQDIQTSGNYDLMEGVFDIIRRMLITSLLPNHLTPWSDSATTQGAEAAMPPLLGRVKAAQSELINFLNETIIDELRKSEPRIAEDATYVFDEPKIIDDKYYIEKIVSLIDANIITTETGKAVLLKLGIIPEDIVDDEEEQQKSDDSKKEESLSESSDFKEDDETLVESIKGLNSKLTFPQFRRKLTSKNPKLTTSGWKQVKHDNIGGHDIRLVKADDTYLLFDGLSTIETLSDIVANKVVINKLFNDYVQKVKDSFKDFKNDKSEEDLIMDDLEKDIKQQLKDQLAKIDKLLDKSEVKKESLTEGFLSLKIFPKIDDLFKGFNININKSVTNAMRKLNVTVRDNPAHNFKVDDTTKKMLDRKNKLMTDNIKRNIKATKDKMLLDIKTQLSTGIAAGQSVSDIKKGLRKQFNYDKKVDSGFAKVVRTSVGNTSKILKLKKFQNMGFTTAIWITREDQKVRSQHAKLNNKELKIDYLLKALSDNTIPGGIWQCRCDLLPGN